MELQNQLRGQPLKKIVVVQFMGENPPKSFGLKESCVIMRDMLPEISLTDTEKEVRSHIRELLHLTNHMLCVQRMISNF